MDGREAVKYMDVSLNLPLPLRHYIFLELSSQFSFLMKATKSKICQAKINLIKLKGQVGMAF